MRRHILFKQCGAFLLEALLATVILGFGLVGIIRAFSMGIDAHKRSQEYLTASVLLENILTDLLVRRYFDESLVGDGDFEKPFMQCRYDISADDVVDSDVLKVIEVTVLWNGNKQPRTLSAATYMLVESEGKELMSKRVMQKNAFTLIEVILGAMLFSIIALSVYSVFSQGLNIERRLRISPLTSRDVFLAISEIASDLENIRLFTSKDQEGQYFDAKHDEISFVIAQDEGLKKVHYGLVDTEYTTIHREEVNMQAQDLEGKKIVLHREEGRLTKRLVRTMTPLYSENEKIQETLIERVIDGEFNISYLEINDEGQRIWKDNWDDEAAMPAAVRIDLKVNNEQQQPLHLVRDIYIPLSAGYDDEE